MIAFGLVALLHVGLGYALISGLALKAVKAVTGPMETINIEEEAPPPEEPPPPPPKELEIPPFVPPPEVTVQTDAPPPPTIQVQNTVAQPEPPRFVPAAPVAAPAPAPAPVGATQPARDKGRGNTISEDDYPDASRRAEEQGVTRIAFTVSTDGRVTDCSTAVSSGHPRLDDQACKVAMRRWRFEPALREGSPVAEPRQRSVRWQLKDAR